MKELVVISPSPEDLLLMEERMYATGLQDPDKTKMAAQCAGPIPYTMSVCAGVRDSTGRIVMMSTRLSEVTA